MNNDLIWLLETARTEDITDDEYFQKEPWKYYISNSKLNLVDPSTGGNIKLFEKSFKSEKRSKALQVGTITHSLLLQADSYGVSDIIRPSGKLGDIVYDVFKLRSQNNISIQEALDIAIRYSNYYNGRPMKGILKKIIRDGLPYYMHLRLYRERDFILNSEEVNIVLGCLDSLKCNSNAMEILFPADKNILRFNEMAIACDVKLNDTVYTLKIKIDNWNLNLKTGEATLNDLKTTGSGLQNFVNGYWEFYPGENDDIRIFHPGSFQKYKYYRQLAMYSKVLEMFILKEYGFIPKININIVAVETREPYWSDVFSFGVYQNDTFSARQLTVGLDEMKNLLYILKDNNYVSGVEGFNRQSCAFI